MNPETTQMYKDAMKGIACVLLAAFAWLFGGSFRETLASAHHDMFPRPQAERVEADVARIEAETERLMATLEAAPEDPLLVARRFLRGEMTTDLAPLGTTMARRVVAIRVQGLPHESWSDDRLRGIIRGREDHLLDNRVMRRIAEELEWTPAPAFPR